ncbi:hypothetical protein V1521DRAFT_463256 [Lipomyces starkeyi]
MISEATVSWHLLNMFHAKVQTNLHPLIPYITSFSITIPVLQAVLEKCFICFIKLTPSGSQASSRIALFDVADFSFKASNYPFNMSLFRNLKVLNVYYTVKSEAFTVTSLLYLKRLILHLDLFSPVRQKSWYPSLRECNDLEFVSLKGFRRPPIEIFEALPDSLIVVELNFVLLRRYGSRQICRGNKY